MGEREQSEVGYEVLGGGIRRKEGVSIMDGWVDREGSLQQARTLFFILFPYYLRVTGSFLLSSRLVPFES